VPSVSAGPFFGAGAAMNLIMATIGGGPASFHHLVCCRAGLSEKLLRMDAHDPQATSRCHDCRARWCGFPGNRGHSPAGAAGTRTGIAAHRARLSSLFGAP